ncbi:MAG: O-antigen ligase family protein [Candidatus Harrisonbacteria bacterium]|nr:O-antigen ligase family protein [Candidatus Harrisonbacteria bacterium]
MSSSNLKNYYIWGIKALVFIIPFLSVWIATSMYFPYITGRNFGFRILVEVALVLYIALAILDKRYRPRMNLLSWAILVFVGIVGIADLFGVDPMRSLWSNYERMEGYITILHLGAYFFVLTNLFRSKKEWLVFFRVFLAAGLWVGIYGVLQIFGVKEAIQGNGARIDGTIGNPTYLAVYLTLIIGLSLILFFNTQSRSWKYFYGSIIAFLISIMFFTASRGAALAWAIAVPLFLILYLWLFRKEKGGEKVRKIMIGILIAMVIAPPLFLLIKNQSWVREHPVLSRFTQISFQERTTRSRFMIWGMGAQGFLERPLLGWGQENYLQVFSKYYNPSLYDQEPWFDRSHNIVFDWLINAGILGLLAYLSLFTTYYVLFARGWKSGKVGKKEGLVLLVLPIAYFIQNLFVFDNINTYIIFFTLLAYVNNWESESIVERRDRVIAEIKPSLIALAVSGLIALPIVYLANVKPALQARSIISGLAATSSSKDPVGETLSAFEKALSYNTFGNGEALEQLGRVTRNLLDQDVPNQIKTRFINYLVPKIEEYLKKHPNDIRIHLFIADIYQSAINIDESYVLKAREHFEAALALSPQKQQILTALANNFLFTGESEKSFELLRKAIDVEPSNIEAHGNYAIYAVLASRNDLVAEEIAEMNRLQKNLEKRGESAFNDYLDQLKRIAEIYRRVDQIQNAIIIYQELIRLSPTNVNFQTALKELQSK